MDEAIEILLVEDNPGDVRLIIEVLKNCKIQNKIEVVCDGEEALNYLHKKEKYQNNSTPDLILLDLNLPKKDGREVLRDLKKDEHLKKIPVVILTSLTDKSAILESYNNHANCFISKPVGLDEFENMVREIEKFWLETAKLPKNK